MEEGNEAPFVIGRPLVTIFHNPDSLFTIAKLKVIDTNCEYEEKEMIVKGSFPQLSLDDDYKFTGKLVNHPTYGAQFDVHMFMKEMPGTETGLIHYLSGDLFPGIGIKTAETIVEKLGKDSIKKILDDSTVLDAIPRLSTERKETIISVLEQNMGLERTVIQLNEWGFGPKISMRIYQTYRENAINILTENPYRLIEEIEGVGFQKADELGKNLGIIGDHPSRIKAAVLHAVNEAVQSEGHVYIEGKVILPTVKRLLEMSQSIEIDFSSISNMIIEMVEEGKLSAEKQRLYMPSLYFSEIGFAAKMMEIMENETEEHFPVSEIRKAIGEVEEEQEVNYAETQVAAIEAGLHSRAMILTGGPGTGKTTVIRGFVEVFAKLHGLSLDPTEYAKKKEPFPIVLAAPTGRAAKRMSESTGLPAMTIHRLLGFNGQEKDEETEREIKGKLVIIDEMSMVDTWLAHQLMKALPQDIQILFVGDQDQLPSVGPGQVLKDMLDSGEIPIIELTEIYRQSAGSTIIEMAHMIKRNEWIDNIIEKTSDRSFIQAGAGNILEVVGKIVGNAISKGHSIKDIQVLAPMYRGPAGIDSINKMLQEMVNPPGPERREVVFGDAVYRVGDKVLQLVNQPESNVFNGDMGEVIAIIKAKETVDKKELLLVSYDGIEVPYERSDLNQLTLSYCCSIHKAQGSEFPIVIMPVVRGHRKMLKRNLLYTGITRAQKFLILCGEPEEFKAGIARADELERQTTLKERLNGDAETSEDTSTVVTNSDSNPELVGETRQPEPQSTTNQEARVYELTMATFVTIDPMIGMDGVTPYTFLEGVD